MYPFSFVIHYLNIIHQIGVGIMDLQFNHDICGAVVITINVLIETI